MKKKLPKKEQKLNEAQEKLEKRIRTYQARSIKDQNK